MRSNDWLARNDIEHNGQTLGEYLQAHRVPLANSINELRVLPILVNGRTISAQHRQLVEASADFLQRYFQMKVTLMETENIYEVPTDATRLNSDGSFQVNSVYLLKRLQAARKPLDPVTIAFVEEDLWPGNDWNYVFGQASTTSRVGVWSTSRLKEQSESEIASTISLRRTLHIAAHETGHMLGFSHCTAFQCCMNGCNNRDELDRQPLEYCSECLSKLWWTCKIDTSKRAKELLDFSVSRGLEEDADFWRKQAKLLTTTD
jgi:archaemetzincin